MCHIDDQQTQPPPSEEKASRVGGKFLSHAGLVYIVCMSKL